MAPLEAQIREHKNQLKNRMQSIQRIHVATDSLEDKIASFEALQAEVDAQKQGLQQMQDNLKAALSADLKNLKVAA
jgi:peptidoglycan hydrolase CwlO-like protein